MIEQSVTHFLFFVDVIGRYSPPIIEALQPNQSTRKRRSFFTDRQVLELEQAFERKPYLEGNERQQLSIRIGITETQVKTWFQNRRMKKKRKRTEETQYYTKLAFANRLASGVPPQGFHGYQSPMYPTILPYPNLEAPSFPSDLSAFQPFAPPPFCPGADEYPGPSPRFIYPPFCRQCPGTECSAVPKYSYSSMAMASSPQNLYLSK